MKNKMSSLNRKLVYRIVLLVFLIMLMILSVWFIKKRNGDAPSPQKNGSGTMSPDDLSTDSDTKAVYQPTPPPAGLTAEPQNLAESFTHDGVLLIAKQINVPCLSSDTVPQAVIDVINSACDDYGRQYCHIVETEKKERAADYENAVERGRDFSVVERAGDYTLCRVGNCLSVLFSLSETEGNHDAVFHTESLNFSLDTGTILTLDEILSYTECRTADQLADALRRKISQNPDDYYEDAALVAQSLIGQQNCTFTPNGVVVSIAPGQISPLAMGAFSITLPYADSFRP